MDVISIAKFVTPTCCIEFHPVDGVPGHSHKVLIDGKPQEGLWLPADQRPNKKNAVFFVRVYAALKAGLPKYHYVDRQEDPPLPSGVAAAM